MTSICKTLAFTALALLMTLDSAAAQGGAVWRRYQSQLASASSLNTSRMGLQAGLAGAVATWTSGMTSTNSSVRSRTRSNFFRYLSSVETATTRTLSASQNALASLESWYRMHPLRRHRNLYNSSRANLIATINGLHAASKEHYGLRRAALNRW